MKKQVIVSLSIVFAVIVVLGIYKFVQISIAIAQSSNFAPPPEAVTSIVAKEESWQSTLSAIGSIAPVEGVVLSVEEPGEVEAIHFQSGAKVNKGDLLIELDTSVEEGNLGAALGRERLAQKNLDRMQSLKSSSAVSKGDVDSALAALDQAKGEVAALRALIAKKRIVAPFSGNLGIRNVNVGQYLQAGTEIVPLFSMDKVFVDFWLPQQSLSKIQIGVPIKFTSDSYPGEKFEAKITAINPQIDQLTRTVKVQATSENPESKLRSGMFVKVEVGLPEFKNYISIPNSSISFAPYGNSVYIIEKMKDPKGNEYSGVRQQTVVIGPSRGEQVAVLKGIDAGQEIVTSGVFKLRPGSAVTVDNSFAPENKIDVNPPNT